MEKEKDSGNISLRVGDKVHSGKYGLCEVIESCTDGCPNIFPIVVKDGDGEMHPYMSDGRMFPTDDEPDIVPYSNPGGGTAAVNRKLLPFDIGKAKGGHPVCTRDGRPVRILCTDYLDRCKARSVVALVKFDGGESIFTYDERGKVFTEKDSPNDLFLVNETVTKTGWANIFTNSYGNAYLGSGIHSSEEKASIAGRVSDNYVDTVFVKWEEPLK